MTNIAQLRADGSLLLRRCPSCSDFWVADTEADYDEFDHGGVAVIAPHKEDCGPCRVWWANLHLENPPVGQFIHAAGREA